MKLAPYFYHYFIDPLLAGSLAKIVDTVPIGRRVLDIACGTGSLVINLAAKSEHVTGIDIDPFTIRFAKRKNPKNTDFMVGDARDMKSFRNKQFDFVIMSMAWHQFQNTQRDIILAEAIRVGEKILISDYSSPSPNGYKKILVKTIERIAGKDHYRNFKSYMAEGGITRIEETHNLNVTKLGVSGSGIFTLFLIEER
jgi:ubiquinone/menaquinone biosynthesis C-methylase UbiE